LESRKETIMSLAVVDGEGCARFPSGDRKNKENIWEETVGKEGNLVSTSQIA
jgi:hypothetical protein